MTILGISAFCHNSAAALVRDGEIVAAAEEERFSRVKHDTRFPHAAVAYCLKAGGLQGQKVDMVVFHERPWARAARALGTCLSVTPREMWPLGGEGLRWVWRGCMMREWIERELVRNGCAGVRDVWFARHEESHLASAFFPSPYERAAVMIVDGVGEWATTVIGVGEGAQLRKLREIRSPHSLGVLYTAFTQYCGFAGHDGEYKLMGLAPYGEPTYVGKIVGEMVEVREDGSFQLNMEYFGYGEGEEMREGKFARLFGGQARKAGEPLTQREANLARSVQEVVEEIILRMVRYAREVSGAENLCMAGEVAFNCVANGRVVREGPFRAVWIQPGAGDAGGAIGAALLGWHRRARGARIVDGVHDGMRGAYLGPEITDEGVAQFLREHQYPARHLEEGEWAEEIAKVLVAGHVVGLAQGRMEFGPRALGNRSILADPRSAAMRELLNAKIKYRESFRPFAPSCREERAREYFDLAQPSPYMLIVAPVRHELRRATQARVRGEIAERLREVVSVIPAVTHVDYSARVQTVTRQDNPRFCALLEAWERVSGCGVLVNTSFNVAGEPIVCSVDDAYRCFMKSGLDYLVLGSYLLEKRAQLEVRSRGDMGDAAM